MSLKKSDAKVEITSLPIDKLYEFPGNPNEEDTLVFNNLIKEIDQDGFDQPLVVVPAKNVLGIDKEGYVVVSGNHRLKALKTNSSYETVDCVIKDWDAEKAKIKVVRRNLLVGELNSKKFTELVDSLATPYTTDQLADIMGFTSIEEFEKSYHKEVEEQESVCADPGFTAGNKPEDLIDGLSNIINHLFAEYGETVIYSFMFFLFGSKVHLAVQANTQLKKILEIITKRCIADKLDINLILTGLLSLALKESQFTSSSVEELISLATKDQDVACELTAVNGV